MFASYSRMCSSIVSAPSPTHKVQQTYPCRAPRRGFVAVACSTSNNTNHQVELLYQLLADKDKRLMIQEQLMTQLLEDMKQRLKVEEQLRTEQRRRLEMELEWAHIEILHAKGLLSMRGLMDWAEQKLKKKHYATFLDAERKYEELHKVSKVAKQKEVEKQQQQKKQSTAQLLDHPEKEKWDEHEHFGGWDSITHPKKSKRVLFWEVVLCVESGLRDCIVEKTGWQAKDVPSRLDALYITLSNKRQENLQFSLDKVDLVVGVVSEKDCVALQCIGNKMHVRTHIVKSLEELSRRMTDAE